MLLEEYRTVRQERLEGVTRIQSIVQYGVAAIGVLLTVALLAAFDHEAPVPAATIVMGLIPLLLVLVISSSAAEIQRVMDARQHLRVLETRINCILEPEGKAPVLSWESTRSYPRGLINPFKLAGFATLAATAAMGPLIGGLILLPDRTIEYAIGVAFDVAVLGGLGFAFARMHEDVRALAPHGSAGC